MGYRNRDLMLGNYKIIDSVDNIPPKPCYELEGQETNFTIVMDMMSANPNNMQALQGFMKFLQGPQTTQQQAPLQNPQMSSLMQNPQMATMMQKPQMAAMMQQQQQQQQQGLLQPKVNTMMRPPTGPESSGLSAQLAELNHLHQTGGLGDDEFAAAK